jgi:HD-like signal output (HDOD) protein/nitrogen-specific signal transduction histidine kinase
LNNIPGPIARAIESLHLPAMPQILLRFLDEAGSGQASMDSLAELVMRDPALSARVLTVANSAAFRRGSELRSIKQSLIALGTRLVRTIASCLVVQNVFSVLPGTKAQDLAGFWRHSLFVAELARATAQELGMGDAECEEAYLAGLLHDVGQLVLLGGLGKAYGKLLSRSQSEEDLIGNERPALSTDHSAVGAWLVDQWQLPSLMADAILFHHMAPRELLAADPLSRILWLAHRGGLSPTDGEDDEAGIAAVLEAAKLAPDRFLQLCEEAAGRVDSLASALGVSATPVGQTLPRWADADDEPIVDDADARLQATVSAMAAMQPLQQNFAGLDDDADLLVAVRESARILFGVQRLALLLVPRGRQLLSGAGVAGQPAVLQRLEVMLDRGAGLCAEAARTRQPRSSFDEEPPVAPSLSDRQIARALGSEGLLALPMAGQGGLVGVMVCGVSEVQQARLRKRLAWLQSFATLAAAGVEAVRRVRERDRRTEDEAAERFRLQGQKLAHEAANPLGIIRNYLTIVDLKLPEAKALGQEIAILREEIDRVSAIIRQLGEDAAPPAPPGGALDLNQLVSGMRALYSESMFGARGVTLKIELTPEPALATADRDSVKQILLNLWKNSAEAVSNGGKVLTAVATRINQDGRFYTLLRVSDSGPGLPEQVLQSLYRPLAPPHDSGRSGLGLSIVHSLVEKLDGHITCHSRPGLGTSFTVLLPATERT